MTMVRGWNCRVLLVQVQFEFIVVFFWGYFLGIFEFFCFLFFLGFSFLFFLPFRPLKISCVTPLFAVSVCADSHRFGSSQLLVEKGRKREVGNE